MAQMKNTDCSDVKLDSQGCMAIARLMLDIIDTPLVDRLNEPGTCEICKRPLRYAWRVIELDSGKEWEFEKGSETAGKCQRKEFSDDKFLAFPNYYCDHALDRWGLLTSNEQDLLVSIYLVKDRQREKVFLETNNRVSPVDIAYALLSKRRFDAVSAFVPIQTTQQAPMDGLR